MKSYGHITGKTDKIFLFILCIKWCKGTNFQKYFPLALTPLTATPIYNNNQLKLLYMASVTIFAVTLSQKSQKLEKSDSGLQCHFTSEIDIMYFYVRAATPWPNPT